MKTKKLKRMVCFILSMIAGIAFCSCSAEQGQASTASSKTETTNASETTAQVAADSVEDSVHSESKNQTDNENHILVAYFSWSGNTQDMADYIADKTGAEIFVIEPQTPYSDDYNTVGEVAKVERDENQRPAIANLPESLDSYDTIIIGYPIWWHTAPMIIGTFLESYDLSGKDVYPFTQSASMDTEQFENSMEFVRSCAIGANVHDGLFTEHTDTSGIDAYLSENGLIS